MYIPRVFIPQTLALGSSITVGETKHHHLSRVLRLSAGAQVILFNGEGGEFVGHVTATSKHQTLISIEDFDPISREPKLNITLLMSVLKRDAMISALQRATELGVAVIIPMLTQHLSEKRTQVEKRFAAWQGVIEHASEQSGRTCLPHLKPPTPFETALADVEAAAIDHRLIAHLGSTNPPDAQSKRVGALALAIGPEGGFSADEVALAETRNFVPYSVGPRTLRAETASAALLSHLYTAFGEYR